MKANSSTTLKTGVLPLIRQKVSTETLILGIICMLDMLSTVWLLITGNAREANPLLNYFIETGGITAFIAAKGLLSIGPLLALEMLYHRHPAFIRATLRAGIALYLTGYLLLTWGVNG